MSPSQRSHAALPVAGTRSGTGPAHRVAASGPLSQRVAVPSPVPPGNGELLATRCMNGERSAARRDRINAWLGSRFPVRAIRLLGTAAEQLRVRHTPRDDACAPARPPHGQLAEDAVDVSVIPGRMPQRHQVPQPLAGRIFARPEAMAVGLTSRQLRAPYYERVASGIWRSLRPSAASARPDARAELIQLARAQREAMPGHAISHQSAAVLWGFRRRCAVWRCSSAT